ncbi:MAG: TAXI family TRAP transporter solute-binding subunit, partial [Gemmatimonadota bacterium]|nr:TAXI family TRAP transporter solute-binding subunit [Gemmatimonadota bacterium]
PQYLSFSESTAALRDGAVGAAIFSVGVPAAAVLEATTSGNVRMIGVTPERTAELRERYPYYSAGMIPAGSYPGVDEALPTVGMMNWMVADEALDDDVVELLLNILDEDRVSLGQVHDMAKQIDLRQLDEAPIPLHPAAEEFVSRR